MKQYSTTYLCLILIFIGLTFKSQAAISENTAIDTVLVIEQISSEKEISKRRIYKRGEKIAYKIKGDKKPYKGKIIGFSDTELIIKDKTETVKTIAITDIDKLRRVSKKGVLSILLVFLGIVPAVSFGILLLLLLFVFLPISLFFSIDFKGILDATGIALAIATVPMIIGFLGNRPFRSYKFGKKWKAKISTIQKVDE